MAGVLSGARVPLRRGLVCAERVMSRPVVGREMLSVSVGGEAGSYRGNKMNGLFPDS